MPLTVGRAPLADDVRPTRDGPAGLLLHRRLLDQRAELLRADRALRDGFTSGGGLGLGLGGSKRLVSELRIETEVGVGSRITALKWK